MTSINFIKISTWNCCGYKHIIHYTILIQMWSSFIHYGL